MASHAQRTLLAIIRANRVLQPGLVCEGCLIPHSLSTRWLVNDLGGLPLTGGAARLDRPYGETEAIWDAESRRMFEESKAWS
jgi:hypothetical protein